MILAPHEPSAAQRRRQAHRRRQTVTSVLVAAASTAALGTLLVVAVTGAPGWDRVRESFADPAIARDALLLGLLVAILRTLRGPVFLPVRALAAGYTYTFRGLPLIIVLYVLTLGVPGLRLSGMPPVLVLGGLALVLTYGGYLAEVFRAGVESVHPASSRRPTRSG